MEVTEEHNKAIRNESGNVVSTDRVVSFFYELMRDHLPAGVVEGIVQRVLAEDYDAHYCNGWLARHAKFIVRRLRGDETGLVVTNCFIKAKPGDPGNPFLHNPVVLNGYAIIPREDYDEDGSDLRSLPLDEGSDD